MSRRKNGLLDQFGNYLCALGNSAEKIAYLIIPLVIALLVLVLFAQITAAVVPPLADAVKKLELTETMKQDVDLILTSARLAWLAGGLMMLWQRQRGAVNAIQTSVSTIFYLTIAFSMIAKIFSDITGHHIKTDGLGLVLYLVTLIVILVVLCLIALLATVLGTPIAVASALIVGVGFDLLFNYFRAESIRTSKCFREIKETMGEINVESEISEVQLIDSGIYFVNPAARVVRRVDFADYEFAPLNMWTLKPFMAQIMRELPDGYTLESLKNMWVANNTELLNKLAEMEATQRRAQAKAPRAN